MGPLAGSGREEAARRAGRAPPCDHCTAPVAGFMQHRDVLVFVDNESAKVGLIKGYSPVPASDEILRHSVTVGSCAFRARFCFARVPLAANVADPASRLDELGVRAVLPHAREDRPVFGEE